MSWLHSTHQERDVGRRIRDKICTGRAPFLNGSRLMMAVVEDEGNSPEFASALVSGALWLEDLSA
jgi:hypothetical protein